MIGTEPQLVIYDRVSNINMVRGTVAKSQKLPRCSARAERIAVAGGGQVLTQYGSYRALLPLPNSGSKKELQCQGIQSITGPIKRYRKLSRS